MLRPRFYKLFEDSIESGATRGVNRAYKYSDSPTREELIQSITNCIMGDLHENFIFPDETD